MTTWRDEQLADIVEADGFEDVEHGLDDEIDEGYRRRYGSSTAVDHISSSRALSTTIRLVPS